MASEPNEETLGFDELLFERGNQSDTILRSAATQTFPDAQNINLSIAKYPQDVGTNEVPHYAMFYINVRRTDLSATEQKSGIANVKFDTSKQNRVDRNAVSMLGGAVVGGGLSLAVGNALGATAPFFQRIFAGVGAVGGAVVGQNLIKGQETVMLTDVIALYMNEKPSAQYKANWSDQELGFAGGISRDFFGSLKNLGNAAVSAATYAALKDVGSKGSPLAGAGGAVQASAGIVPNPFKAQLFKNMGFRSFTYTYTFLPRNANEYQAAQDILFKFKKYMHPTTGNNKLIMGYPAEFNIVYYHKGSPNKELFKISNCALTDMKIEYGGQDFTTFKGIPGAPTEMTMVLTFVELEYLTRDRIENGEF